MNTTPLYASVADPLADRLRNLKAARGRDDFAEYLLGIARELTLAEAGAVIGGDPPTLFASSTPTGDLPHEWSAAAARAGSARGVWAGPHGGRWIFAVPVGPVGALTAPGPPAVLVLEIATRLQMDLALTRERLVVVGALAETITQAAAGSLALGAALAVAAVEALLRGPDERTGFAQAASVVARGAAGIERLALVRLARGRASFVALADEPNVDRAADLPRLLVGLVEEAFDLPDAAAASGDVPDTPAQEAYFARFGRRALLVRLGPERRLGVAATLRDEASPADAAVALAPAVVLLERVLDPRPPRLSMRTRTVWLARAAAAVALLGLLAVVPRADIVEAPATLQPEWQQVISAPFDGVVESSKAQPGDIVEAGKTVLARLETREIELEIAAARARAANELRDATVARAGGQPAQEQLALLAAKRAEAQLALLSHRLAAADLRSPLSGVIASGDLRRSLGQPVLRGQTLFEVAPSAATRAEVRVLDEDIPRVAAGQTVTIMPAAEPNRPRRGVVERVRPTAEVIQQRNAFLVIAQLDPDTDPLRPGSEGVAHIETGRTTWLASLLRQPVRFIRRMLWI